MTKVIKSPECDRVEAGLRIKKAMTKKGYSAVMLSNLSGISYPTVLDLIRGRTELHRDDLLKLAEALEVRPSWIAWG